MRAIVFAAVVAFLVGAVGAVADSPGEAISAGQEASICLTTSEQIAAPGLLQPAACCKVCKKGKACGDSCISKSKTCRKAPGCACDGYMPEVPADELNL